VFQFSKEQESCSGRPGRVVGQDETVALAADFYIWLGVMAVDNTNRIGGWHLG
jgi:hypothetical protein